ncbi:MAG: acetamidase/formamidase family protein [Burkholderiales bacterium]|nr:acetamidase/formamidase family protein [Burkholderiales bacterium]
MKRHHLPASAETVRVGVIDRAFPAVLEVDDGDEVELETWGLWGNAVTPTTRFEDIQALRQAHAGRGPHSLTGPIAVRGATSAMLLRVDILELELGPYGFNLLSTGPNSRGLLAHEFAQGELRHYALDGKRLCTEFLPGFEVPLSPFLGIMGVAPRDEGPHPSPVPGDFGGNIDCPELVAGTSLFLPVWQDGALFYAGDAHAVQGCGEVDQTALETSMKRALLRLGLTDERRLERPHALTREHLVTMGFHADLREAARQATSDLVRWLVLDYRLTREDAYVLCSLQADLMVTQAVNGNNGVHARMSRSLLAPLARRPGP